MPERRAAEWGVRLRAKRPSKQVKMKSPVVGPSNSSLWPNEHEMWWQTKGKAFVRGRLLSRGNELLPQCPVRAGDWGPFAERELESRDRQATDFGPGRPFSLP